MEVFQEVETARVYQAFCEETPHQAMIFLLFIVIYIVRNATVLKNK
jgi:hypothetical protein